MALTPGARLGPYEVTGQLGAGGMGEVYKARDTRLDRTVAIKVLPTDVSQDADLRARFEREARAIAALDHPHICALYDVGEHEGTLYLVMQHLEGETLAARLARANGPLLLDQALKIAIEIADALDKAHRAGMTHRDLKPANIMLTRSGAKLLDFGLAKLHGPAAAISMSGMTRLATATPNTARGTILGTVPYMAPEQLEGQEADARTDIFAFGAMLYEMVTGQRAFEGNSPASLIAAILTRDPPPASSLRPVTPAALDRLVTKCLAKDPDRRWQSASDLRDELTWIADTRVTASSVSATAAGAIARGTRERLAWTMVATTLLLVAVLAVPAARYVRRTAPELPLTRLDLVTPPTTDPFSFALSPDGRQIVFVAATEDGSKLWVRPLDQTIAHPLAGTDRARAPFWAPDSRAIGFFADSSLKTIDLAGGPPRVLTDTPVPYGGTWNRDGVIVLETTSGPRQVAAAGGAATPLTHPAIGEKWPQFLPDGRRFLFYDSGRQGVYLGSLDGAEPTRVMAAESAATYAPPGYLVLVSQGVLVARHFDEVSGVVSGDPLPIARVGSEAGTSRGAFTVSAAGVLAYRSNTAARRQLAWVDRAGKTLGLLLPPEDTGLSSVDLALDGRHAAFTRIVEGNTDIFQIEVARGITSQFTFAPGTDASALWSPDGTRLVFRSNRNGNYDLFEKPANGTTDERPLLVTPQDKSPLAWSMDGQFLLYSAQDSKAQSDLWALPMTGGHTPIPVVTTRFDDVQGQFSPDGRWVAYASNEAPGRYEIYLRPFGRPGDRFQVSTGGGIYPRWRRDGHELFYIAPDNRMMAVAIQFPAEGGTPNPATPVALFATRLTTGNTGNAGFSSRAQYAVAADGRFLLNVSVDDVTASPITIVQNWTAGLKP